MTNFTRYILSVLTIPVLFVQAHEGTHSGGDEMPALTNRVQITTTSNYREFRADSLPDHSHGRFPNPGNPHEITPQSESLRIPVSPSELDSFRAVGMSPFGIALNGILFEPAAAEFWQNNRRSSWQYEALGHHLDLGEDANHAHVQPTGKYHYHGVPTGLVENRGGSSKPARLGYAADGYPIYSYWSHKEAKDPTSELVELKSSYQIKSGLRSDGPGGAFDGTFVQDYEYVKGLGDLDQANGRFGVTAEYPEGTYYYVITADFPFIPRYWRGRPSPDFGRGPGGNQNNAGGGPPQGGRNRARGPGSAGLPEITLLRDESFLNSLNLTSAKSVGLNRALRGIEQSMRQGRNRSANADPDDRRGQRIALLAKVEPQITAVREEWLSSAQNRTVDQTLHRQEGANLLLKSEIQTTLHLTEAQIANIYQAIIYSRASNSIALSWAEVADFLDAPQQGILTDLIGTLD